MADQDNGWGDNVQVAPTNAGWGDDPGPDPLKGSIKYGSKVAPDQAAKILNIQSKTGLPTDLIERNADELENQAEADQVDPDELHEKSPHLASWLASNLYHFSLAGPDLYNLQSIEGLAKDVGTGIHRGALEVQRSAIGLKGLFGMAGPDDADKVSEIEARMASMQSHGAPEIYGKLAENIPVMGGAVAAGAGAAFLAGTAGAPVAAAAGAATLARGALFGASSAGSAYLDYQKIRDENNRPIDPGLARGAALSVGVLNGILQEKVFANIAEKVPAFQSLMPDGMKAMLQSQTMRAAIGNYLLKIGEQAGAQGGVQWINSMAQQGAGKLSELVSNGSIHEMTPTAILSTVFSPEAFKQAAEEAKSGAVLGGAMATGFSAYDFAHNYHQIIHATETARSYEDMGTRVQQMKMLESSPQKTEEAIRNIVQGPSGDAPSRNTYLPIRDFNEHYQGKNIDPREAYQAITGSYEGYDESSRTGADLQIPTEKYLTTIGVVPEDNKSLSQSVRTDPAAMNAKEAEQASKLIKKGRGEEGPEEAIKNDIAPNVPEPLPVQETEPITPPPTLAVIQPGSKTGDPHALFAYNDDFGPNMSKRSIYNVFGDPENPKVKTAGWGSSLTKADIDKFGIPITGREPRSAQFEPLDFASKEVSPEKRAVAQVEERQGFKPLFEKAQKIMPEAEAAKYNRAVEEVHAKAQEELASKIIDRKLREKSTAWMDERKGIEDEVRADISTIKEFGVIESLRKHETPDGSKIARLDANIIENEYGYKLSDLPEGTTVKSGGLNPDDAAMRFGYDSGSEMVWNLLHAPDREEWIKDETDRQMLERHPNNLAGDNLVERAMEAVHSEQRSRLLMLELKYLASDHMSALKGLIQRVTRPLPKITEVRDEAERFIGAKKVADIAPSLYLQEEARASREAGIHFSKGDLDATFEAKQRELLNHELYRAAISAREGIAKGLTYVKRLNKESVRERIGKASGGQIDYLGQIDDILDRFDFRKATLKELSKLESLRQFIANRQNEGYSPEIPERILEASNRRNYKELSLTDFNDVMTSLKAVQNLAELKGELLANAKERSFDTAKNNLIQSIFENNDVKTQDIKPRRTNETHFVKSFLASMTRLEFVFDRLDGYKPNGQAYNLFFKPTVDAQNAERDLMIKSMYHLPDGLAMNDIFDAYTKNERALWYYKKIYIPEIDTSLLKPNILMAALNLGNDYNRSALKEGYNWTDEKLKAVTDHLDERDWNTVQKIWDHLEIYKPLIGQLEKSLNGVEPEWVKSDSFDVTLKNGKTIHMRGGYFPVMFDPKLSPEQARLDEKAQAIDLFGGQYAQAMTKFGHTIARTSTGGKPLLLQFSALTGHLENVIHDLSWRKTIIDLNHLINDPEIRASIKGAVGDEEYGLMNPWLRSVAGEKSGNPLNPYETLLGRARGMATVVRLGLGISSGIKHLVNYGMTTNELGPSYSAKALAAVYGKPWEIAKTWENVTRESKMMAAFDESYDRDIRDMFKGMNIEGTREGALSVMDAYTHNMQKAFFAHFGYMYRAVSLPAYVGAKMKALAGDVPNIKAGDNEAAIDYAEHIVRTTIASGATKDLPNIMNQKGLMKLFTMYYGPMNLVFNNLRKAGYEIPKSGIPKAIAAAMFIWFGPAVVSSLMTGKSPGTDDEAEAWTKWIAKTVGFYPMETVIGLRDAARMAESGGRDFSLSPVTDVLAGVTRTAINAEQLVTGQKEEITRRDLNNFADTVGYFTGMPTGQLLKSAEYAYDWMTGEQQPANPLEGIWRVGVGGKRH